MNARSALARRTTAAVAAATVLGLTVAGCSGTTKDDAEDSGPAAASTATADPNAPIEQGLKLAFLPKQINNPYETITGQAGLEAAKALGAEGKRVGPSDASASSQVSYINTLIQQQQDAIMIAANDSNAVCGPLKQAMSKGIKVVAYDSDTARDCRQLFINQARSEDVGRSLIQNVARQINHQGKIAILSATQNATNQNTWIEYMKQELAKPEYKDMQLVKVAYGDDDDQKSFQETQGLLQANPDLKAIIAPTTVGISAAARYIDSSQYKGKVVVNGLGTPNQMRQFVKNGTVEQFSLWDPKKLGKLAVHAAASLASGRITGAEGEKFTAGDLGEYTIGKDGEIILGPPTVFNKDNIDQYDF